MGPESEKIGISRAESYPFHCEGRAAEIIEEALRHARNADFLRCKELIEKLNGETPLVEILKREISPIGIDASFNLANDKSTYFGRYEVLRYKEALNQAKSFAQLCGMPFNEEQNLRASLISFEGINEAIKLGSYYVVNQDTFSFKSVVDLIDEFTLNLRDGLPDKQRSELATLGQEMVKAQISKLMSNIGFDDKSFSEVQASDVIVNFSQVPTVIEDIREVYTIAKLTNAKIPDKQKKNLYLIVQAGIDASLPEIPDTISPVFIPSFKQGVINAYELSEISGTPLSFEQRYQIHSNGITAINALLNSITELNKPSGLRLANEKMKMISDIANLCNIQIVPNIKIRNYVKRAIDVFFDSLKTEYHPRVRLEHFRSVRDLIHTTNISLPPKVRGLFLDFAESEIKALLDSENSANARECVIDEIKEIRDFASTCSSRQVSKHKKTLKKKTKNTIGRGLRIYSAR